MFENMVQPSPIIGLIFLLLYAIYVIRANQFRKRTEPFLVGKIRNGVVTWKDEPQTTVSK